MNTTPSSTATPSKDLYARITQRIVADLEQGVRPWLKAWNAAHRAGSITHRSARPANPTPASTC
jgi:antirestriction protein ArdC